MEGYIYIMDFPGRGRDKGGMGEGGLCFSLVARYFSIVC